MNKSPDLEKVLEAFAELYKHSCVAFDEHDGEDHHQWKSSRFVMACQKAKEILAGNWPKPDPRFVEVGKKKEKQ